MFTLISFAFVFIYCFFAFFTLMFAGKMPITYLLDQHIKEAETAVLEPRQLTVIFVIAAVILLIFLCVQAFRNPPRVPDYLSKEMLDDDAPDEFEDELDML